MYPARQQSLKIQGEQTEMWLNIAQVTAETD